MKFIFLLLSTLSVSCASIEQSSGKVLDNANSIIKSGSDKLFIENDSSEVLEKDDIDRK